MADAVVITRTALYGRVWSEPVTKLAKEFGLSDVGFAKLCKRNDIPRPPRGYWAKQQAGQHQDVTGLPRPDADWNIEVKSQAKPVRDPALRVEAEKELGRAGEERIVVSDSLREILSNVVDGGELSAPS